MPTTTYPDLTGAYGARGLVDMAPQSHTDPALLAELLARTHTLGAFSIGPSGEGHAWRARSEITGPAAVENMVRRGQRAGQLSDEATRFNGHALLVVLDHAGDGCGYFGIPTAEAFAWWEAAVDLRLVNAAADILAPITDPGNRPTRRQQTMTAD